MTKVLQIGPSINLSKGGMSAVIRDLTYSPLLSGDFDITAYQSFIDGSLVTRLTYSSYALLKFVVHSGNYDIYHIHTATRGSCWRKLLYLKLLKSKNKKAILHIHGAEFQIFYDSLPEYKKNKVREMLELSDYVIVLSQTWYDFFSNININAKIVIVENGVDTSFYVEKKKSITSNNFLFLGRMGKRKGAYDLIDAMNQAVAINPNLHLTMAGDGELEDIRQKISNLNLTDHITIYDWVNQRDKKILFQANQTLILPSYNEGLPMAILEAMASGLAIISTPVGGIPEIIHEDNGWLIQPGDISQLSNIILEASYNPDVVSLMGSNNHKLVEEKYSFHSMHGKIKKIYNTLLEAKK
ncbi:TPA: glycosyltransferase family 4 protein [Streptococcus pneumoniae]